MISGIQNIVSNSSFYEATQNAATQMAIKTGLNAVGRPGFILLDNKIDSHTKKFSSTKEFLYQLACLGIYMTLITLVFQKGGFALAKKLYPDEAVFKAFSPSKFERFHKIKDEAEKVAKFDSLIKKSKTGDTFKRSDISEESEHLAHGVFQTSNLIGSVLGLAVIAPLAATKIIHPIMKAIGFDKNSEKSEVKKDEPAKSEQKA